MKKYSWELNGDAERWGNDTYDTIEECIADAKKAIKEADFTIDDTPEVIFIGENVEFVPRVDVDTVLDLIEEQASDFAGDAGHDWDAYDHKKRDELNELEETLSVAVLEWMKKYGYAPYFYAVEDIKEYPIAGGESEAKE